MHFPISLLLFFLADVSAIPSPNAHSGEKRDGHYRFQHHGQTKTDVQDVVQLGYAAYQGTLLGSGVTQYLGMRFAAPPTGDLRWRAPQDPLNVTGVQNATALGPICLGQNQTDPEYQDEDCLFINVWAPSNATRNSRLPVWFYIQGGGYIYNSNYNYNGTDVVVESDQNIIFVNMNYRVSGFGFLASERVKNDGDLNAGLLDQRKALAWVQKYIAEFGGDPDHVVIHGTSAGAGSVGLHLTAYGGRNDNLFIGAVGQSPFFQCQMTVAETEWQFERFASAVGCTNYTEQMACLRAANISDLRAANVPSPFPGQTSTPLFYYYPVIDGDLIPDYPYKLFSEGKHIKVPLIVGDETDEGATFVTNASSVAQMDDFLTSYCPQLSGADLATINDLYPLQALRSQHAAYYGSLSDAYGEQTFICSGLVMSAALSKGQPDQSWNYRFNVTSIESIAAGLGVTHTADIPAILGPDYNGEPTGSTVESFETYNAPIVPILMNYYISFVRTLSPNTLKDAAAPTWEPFLGGASGEQRLLLETNATRMEIVPQAQQQRCAFWQSIANATEQ